jgi:hypothetical protein
MHEKYDEAIKVGIRYFREHNRSVTSIGNIITTGNKFRKYMLEKDLIFTKKSYLEWIAIGRPH